LPRKAKGAQREARVTERARSLGILGWEAESGPGETKGLVQDAATAYVLSGATGAGLASGALAVNAARDKISDFVNRPKPADQIEVPPTYAPKRSKALPPSLTPY
jgi:hypothetical protein